MDGRDRSRSPVAAGLDRGWLTRAAMAGPLAFALAGAILGILLAGRITAEIGPASPPSA